MRVSGWSGPSLAFVERQRLLEQRQGPVELPGVLVASGEVVHAAEGVGVVGAELRLPAAPASPRSSGSARSSLPAAR